MRRLHSVLMGLSALLLSTTVLPQDAATFPSRPVTMIVPYAPGGFAGIETQVYATKASALTGQQFLVDYKAGATGAIGAAYVAKAKPDGYTLLVVTGGFTIFPAFKNDLSFDIIKDFAPVSWISSRTSVLLASNALPVKNFDEYIAYVRGNPGKVNFGTAGSGGINHLSGAWIDSATRTKVTYVHFKGTPVSEVVAGRIDVVPAGLVASLSYIKAGKARALAIMGSERSPQLPDVPTIAEAIPGYDVNSWLGFIAPGATPPAIVNRTSEIFAQVARAPDIVAQLDKEGIKPIGSTPAQLRQLMVTEVDRWKKVVTEGNIKLEE